MKAPLILPAPDPQYDLTFLYPMQKAILPYLPWWELTLWLLFGGIFIWQGYRFLIKPYFA